MNFSSILAGIKADPVSALVLVGAIVIALLIGLFPRRPTETFNIANVKRGKRYAITIAGKEASFLVLSTDESTATFEVSLSSSSDIPGQKECRWAYEISRTSDIAPKLYGSAFSAGYAMEQKFHVGVRSHVHA